MFPIRFMSLIAIALFSFVPLSADAQLGDEVHLSIASSLAPKVKPPFDLSKLPDRMVLRDQIFLDYSKPTEVRYRLRRINCGGGICYEVDVDYLAPFSWEYRGTLIIHVIIEAERTGLEMYDLDGSLRDAWYITRDAICLLNYQGQTTCYPMSEELAVRQVLLTGPFDMYGEAKSGS